MPYPPVLSGGAIVTGYQASPNVFPFINDQSPFSQGQWGLKRKGRMTEEAYDQFDRPSTPVAGVQGS